MSLAGFFGILTLLVGASFATGSLRANVFDAEAAWLPEVEELFHADFYCSAEAAARAVARGVAEQITDMDNWESTGQSMRVAVRADGIQSRVRDAFVSSLEAAAEDRIVAVDRDLGDAIPARLTVIDSAGHQEVRAELDLPRGVAVASAKYVNKAWVESSSTNDRLVRVRDVWQNDATRSSHSAALVRVVDEKIVPRVLELSGCRGKADLHWVRRIARIRVLNRIESSPVLVDRFQQTFFKEIDAVDHVAVQREAILLDLSDENLRAIAQGIGQQVKRADGIRQTTILLSLTSVLAALIVGFTGYRFLNRITQGYYEWSLRSATAAFWVTTFACTLWIAVVILKSL